MDINVLLVDDEKDFVESLAQRLELRGFNVKTAFDGPGAIDKIKEHNFDVIILDVQMPGLSGIDTFKEIKKIEQISQIIMLTGHATVETAIEGMKIGAFDYLMKPTDTKELINKIENAFALVSEQRKKIRKAEIDNIVKNKGW